MAAEGLLPMSGAPPVLITFNGAAAGWPRKVEAARPEVGPVLPSMGPRPDGRGRGGVRAMGARGDPFNGAAAGWPRKEALVSHTSVPPLPSMGPRPDGRGRREWPALGRPPYLSFNGAAAGWPRKALRRHVYLPGHSPSMGPRPDGRGRPCSSRASAETAALQWGRGRMAAEGACAAPNCDDSCTFNGAAAGWPRKDGVV